MTEFREKVIQAEDVANYLNQNREFFHVFPNLLDELSIPHPKSGQAISLLERQIFQLRENKNNLLLEVDTLKNIAVENSPKLQNIYKLSFELMSAETEQEAIDVVYNVMTELFSIEHVSFMSWEVPHLAVKGINQLGISQDWSKSLKEVLLPEKPICGSLEKEWQKGLFATDKLMKSVCVIPLGKGKVWGVLALGSTNERFGLGLDTDFLQVMGNLITARLQRLFYSVPPLGGFVCKH